MSSLMVSATMLHEPLAPITPPSSMLSFHARARLPDTFTVKSWKFFSSCKISEDKRPPCGLQECAGSNHGAVNQLIHGITCKLRFTVQLGESLLTFHSSAVDVRLWELGEYQDRDSQLPLLIDPDWIIGQLAMTTVSVGEDKIKVWASIDLAKVRFTSVQNI
jgi:hypothetical protein